MKRSDINIRDPYVLVSGGKYYLYGTRSESCWDEMDGFDCYVSSDLEDFEGPVGIFHRPEGFFANRCYWAPECYAYDGAFYLVTTLYPENGGHGMFFEDLDGRLLFTLHTPNDKFKEHPVFYRVRIEDGHMSLDL